MPEPTPSSIRAEVDSAGATFTIKREVDSSGATFALRHGAAGTPVEQPRPTSTDD